MKGRANTMSKASELMERVLEKMEERKLYAYYKNRVHSKTEVIPEYHNPEKRIDVEETWNRNNGTPENVTVTIEMSELLPGWSCFRRTLKVRVPKNASDKVIDRRLDEVEKWLRG